jgi:hypothetical protein
MQMAYQQALFQAELAIICSHRRNTLAVLHLFRESGGSIVELYNAERLAHSNPTELDEN